MKITTTSRHLGMIALVCAVFGSGAAAVARQEPPAKPPTQHPQDTPPGVQPPPRVDYDSEPPYTRYERQWNRRFAAPYRHAFREEYYPYGRPYYPRRYWDPYGPAWPYDAPYAFDEGYIGGFHDGRRFQQWQTKAELGLRSYLQAMQSGIELFRSGDYGPATRQFILACKLNQGDAASRLHAVHAMVALGQYPAAAPTLRRALQLQPKLVYLPLDIRKEYGAASDFDAHLQQLAAAAREAGDDPGLWLLLGYFQFFSDRPAEALASLNRASELAPDDSAVSKLLQAARLSTPADRVPAKPPSPTADTGESA